MQKKQLPALCEFGTPVHLRGATGNAAQDATAVTSRNFQTVIIAAAVTDDDLATIGYEGQGEQARQVLVEAIGLVQNRNNDANG